MRNELVFLHPGLYDRVPRDLESLDPSYLMGIANHIAKQNIQDSNGGPFGAIVVHHGGSEPNAIVGIGSNTSTTNCCIFHAELTAIWDGLYRCGLNSYSQLEGEVTLVSSSSPCTMCLGAILWSGINRVITGAPTSEVQKIGFDEGPLPCNLREELSKRGITLVENVAVEECVKVLKMYTGEIYNGTQKPI